MIESNETSIFFLAKTSDIGGGWRSSVQTILGVFPEHVSEPFSALKKHDFRRNNAFSDFVSSFSDHQHYSEMLGCPKFARGGGLMRFELFKVINLFYGFPYISSSS